MPLRPLRLLRLTPSGGLAATSQDELISWRPGSTDGTSVFLTIEVTHMFRNNVKTVVLLTAMGALFMGVGSAFGQRRASSSG